MSWQQFGEVAAGLVVRTAARMGKGPADDWSRHAGQVTPCRGSTGVSTGDRGTGRKEAGRVLQFPARHAARGEARGVHI